ncbi:MAG TPA: hypothetical protein VLW45_13750 [Pelomicrobium sp.]|nr:hypothetical protein [Pelomicrobium sp.]
MSYLESQTLIYQAKALRARVIRELAVSLAERIKRVYRKAVVAEQARARRSGTVAC